METLYFNNKSVIFRYIFLTYNFRRIMLCL